MSVRYMLVDGHSVIFAWPDLRALHDRNRAAARKALADQLQHFHDTTSWLVTLILDGKLGSVAGSPRAQPKDMVIGYATSDQTADSIIERMVASFGVAAQITVVTADEAERLTVESLGANTASPAWLRAEMEREGTSFDTYLDRVHRSARWK